jgi:DnaJ-class molecular chaperone
MTIWIDLPGLPPPVETEACKQCGAAVEVADWEARGGLCEECGWECCPDCNGEGAVLSDRPGYLEVCPTCHGEGEIAVRPC